ncbi:MAG: AAA family ATPase, partial [Candidatus Promineifilaceae bacterium]
YRLRVHGSISESYTRLYDRCENLWSVLRNLRDKSELGEPSYEKIIGFMRESFPTFDKLYLEQQGANSVYGSFIEVDHKDPIKASGVSDGHLQLLTHLTALFSEGTRPTLILFDEPEVSLHPYAISIFAKAVKEASANWNKQVFIATHSPVLISQFETDSIIAFEVGANGQTIMQRVNEIEGIQDLLDAYAVGSLYMSELVAPQSKLIV